MRRPQTPKTAAPLLPAAVEAVEPRMIEAASTSPGKSDAVPKPKRWSRGTVRGPLTGVV
jgi:hypothetical protein